jgi:signal transduction histidine kinase
MKYPVFSRLWLSKLNLRAKVTLGVILPLVLILGCFTAIEHMRHRTLMLNDLSLFASHSGHVVESNLREEMLKSEFTEVQALLNSIGKDGTFRVVYLMDTSGQVIFAPERRSIGTRLENTQPDCQPCHRLPPDKRPGSVLVTSGDGERVFRSMMAIENRPECMQCHDPKKRIIGLLLTDIPFAPMEAQLDADLRENLLWWAGVILVVILVVNLAMNRLVLKRLENLAMAITRFGYGHMPSSLTETDQDEIGQLSRTFDRMAQQVDTRNAENQALSENLQRQNTLRGELLMRLITAQEDERKRLARELHDELGQSLTGLAFKAGLLRHLIASDKDRALQELEQTIQMIQNTTHCMYDLILALRPSVLDDMGLTAALRSHAGRTLNRTGIEFNLDDRELNKRLPPEIETALYRIFQEAMQNVVRHSNATRIQIKLHCMDGTFFGEISDNGQGFDLNAVQPDGSKPGGLGLLGMQERIELIGGCLEILTQPGCGATLRITIPIEEAHDG